MSNRHRFAWLAVFTGAWGCTSILGVDLDYHGLTTGGGSTTTTTTLSTGGAPTTTTGTGGTGGGQTSTGGAGTGGAGTGGHGGDAGTSDAGDASTTDAGDASTTDASDASTADASDAASDAAVCDASITTGDGGACADAGPGTGQLVVTVVNVPDGPDHGALMAVADGTPDVQTPNPVYWPAEKLKTWYTINDYIPFVGSTMGTYTACVPAGHYTLQLWDRFGGGGGTFDNGVPPNVTYGWEIGNSSRKLTVTAGGSVAVTATNTNVNTPTSGAFYGSWTLWEYGPCSCDASCPSGTTCNQGTCLDLAYDIRHCGSFGLACTAQNCCNGACIDESTDKSNCGSCGIACPATQTCMSSACQ